MSLILDDLFPTIQDLIEVVPAVDAATSKAGLNGSASAAKKQICNIITEPIYKTIVAGDDTAGVKTSLSQALANATMAKQVTFDALRNRKAGTDVYKFEQEAMRRGYSENYYNAMDTLLTLLESNEAWKETSYYKMKSALQITTADEFTTLYPIDGSALFFFRTISIQSEILDDIMSNCFDQAKEQELLIKRLKRALAQLTVATAINRFDPLELPVTIRNLYDDSKATRNADGEQSRLLDLSKELLSKAMDTINNVSTILNTSDDLTDFDSKTNFNEPGDGIYLLS